MAIKERWDIERYGYIYLTTNTINGMKYVGKHKSIIFEPWYKGSGVKITEDFDKMGRDNFKVEILEWCYSEEELNEREKFWIDYYNAKNDYNFYNVYDGGIDGRKGYKSSSEFKHHMSEVKLATNERKGKAFWINNGKEEHLVVDYEYEEFLKKDNSYVIGRLPDMVYMYLNDKTIKVSKGDMNEYLSKGYKIGKSKSIADNIAKSRRHSVWYFNDLKFPTANELTNYLKSNGYPNITKSTVVNIGNGKLIKTYSDICPLIKRVYLG